MIIFVYTNRYVTLECGDWYSNIMSIVVVVANDINKSIQIVGPFFYNHLSVELLANITFYRQMFL